MPPEETQRAVENALEAGYRHIDTAAAYRNEAGVGAAIAAAGLRRDEVFVTTKLWNSEQGYDSTLAAFERSLERLGLDHVDLYLIHWPVPSEDRFLDTWRAFERIREEGGARSIGVSNFRVEDLERLERGGRDAADRQPDRAAPCLQQAELRAWHAEHGDRHRGLEPAGPGRRARGRDDRRRSPPTTTGRPAQVDPALAPAARQRRDPQVGDARSGSARTSRSSTSS